MDPKPDQSDYIELSGDALKAWQDEPPVVKCGRCLRFTFDPDAVNTTCKMPQPDTYPCGGTFRACNSVDVALYQGHR